MVRRHPDTVNLRYLAPPLAVLGVSGGAALGLLGWATGSRVLQAGFAGPLGYLGVLLLGAATAPRSLPAAARLRLPLVLAATHLSWGTGFLVGLRHRSSPGPPGI